MPLVVNSSCGNTANRPTVYLLPLEPPSCGGNISSPCVSSSLAKRRLNGDESAYTSRAQHNRRHDRLQTQTHLAMRRWIHAYNAVAGIIDVQVYPPTGGLVMLSSEGASSIARPVEAPESFTFQRYFLARMGMWRTDYDTAVVLLADRGRPLIRGPLKYGHTAADTATRISGCRGYRNRGSTWMKQYTAE